MAGKGGADGAGDGWAKPNDTSVTSESAAAAAHWRSTSEASAGSAA